VGLVSVLLLLLRLLSALLRLLLPGLLGTLLRLLLLRLFGALLRLLLLGLRGTLLRLLLLGLLLCLGLGLLLFLLSAFFAPLCVYGYHGAEEHENPEGPVYFHEFHGFDSCCSNERLDDGSLDLKIDQRNPPIR